MLNPNLAPLGHYTFARLNEVLADCPPRVNEPPILFSLGEPQKATPPILAETVAAHDAQLVEGRVLRALGHDEVGEGVRVEIRERFYVEKALDLSGIHGFTERLGPACRL